MTDIRKKKILKDQENGHTEIAYLRSEDSSEGYVSKVGLEDISFTMNIKNE